METKDFIHVEMWSNNILHLVKCSACELLCPSGIQFYSFLPIALMDCAYQNFPGELSDDFIGVDGKHGASLQKSLPQFFHISAERIVIVIPDFDRHSLSVPKGHTYCEQGPRPRAKHRLPLWLLGKIRLCLSKSGITITMRPAL